MSNKRYRYDIELTIVAPILTQATGVLRLGIDNAIFRDEKGQPALPGTLVRGNLRHAWEDFLSDDEAQQGQNALTQAEVRRLLGTESYENSNDHPHRGTLSFAPYWRTAGNADSESLRYRIAIAPERGAAEDGALQVIESPFASGQPIRFRGSVATQAGSRTEVEHLARWLRLGLWHSSALGALKGVGFGRIQKVAVSYKELAPQKTKGIKLQGERLGLTLFPEAPFCFAKHRPGNNETYNRPGESTSEIDDLRDGISNAFVSEDFIPGSAIKGAVATLLRSHGGDRDHRKPIANPYFPKLSEHLDNITITHAHPVSPFQSSRPETRPLSLVTYLPEVNNGTSEIRVFDVVRRTSPHIQAVLINGKAPLFSIDWKAANHKAVEQVFGQAARPDRSLQVHTAVKAGTNAALEHALFTLDCVVPGEHRWLADITLPHGLDSVELDAVTSELEELLGQSLWPLGKTEMSANAELHAEPHTTQSRPFVDNNEVVITLQSMTRLLSLQALKVAASNGERELFEAYSKSWSELSDNKLKLENFFASQRLVGGAYWWTRFRKRQTPYNPELYTEAGSVFHFKVMHDQAKDAEALLRGWSRRGLPQLADAPGGEDWRQNPYINTNGYGEITVNHPLHWRRLHPDDHLQELSAQLVPENQQ